MVKEKLLKLQYQLFVHIISDNTKYPFNQLPVLEVDGTPISHSMAIMRYLGKEHGMIIIYILFILLLMFYTEFIYSFVNDLQTRKHVLYFFVNTGNNIKHWRKIIVTLSLYIFVVYLGYAPSNNLEQAQADAIVDQCQDFIHQFIWLYFTEKDPERKVINYYIKLL